MGKRVMDLLVATAALALLAPLLLGLALWIKLDSPGPVLFRQQRVGRHGRLFWIHKFRTMRADAEGLPLTVGQDARITPAGQWLRRSKLDELPQLWDVLRGAMSLVGPRPEVPRYVAHYPEHLRAQALAVRPGLTDPVSLAHLHEAELLAAAADPERIYIEQILPAKLEAAVAYAQRASLGSDLRVIGQTIWRLWIRA
ncbi:lipopolysaccharide/colanic/teichoic acid biosynthesis glycosyltransferase [Inhella inkyongensis]|uniref:Lipopolysaccharide/colanic/teichoic acid biosynthesis glycosyltransferase n=1 Tax=Inhella inkyongensis TaxID=392593 RepID=A0A840S2G4_9BURK|nr:sugar transferase [Inhella inkyongensis]MBB5204495.1 lipopolysaccharide/colanic/teichoic acid biosynthesis glycosyltransferase [Inhella inkyongensis]